MTCGAFDGLLKVVSVSAEPAYHGGQVDRADLTRRQIVVVALVQLKLGWPQRCGDAGRDFESGASP